VGPFNNGSGGRLGVFEPLPRADRIGANWGKPATPTLAELKIDCEEDRTLRAVVVAMLRGA
jgi:hypothetical protein